MSDTGGGHRSAAQAIAGALAHELPGRYEITLLDVFKQTAIFPFNHVSDWYLPFVTYAETLWGLGFDLLNNRLVARVAPFFLKLAMGRRLKILLREHPADLILSVHPVFNTFPRQLLRESGSPIPFVTVVTDLFDAHILWFDPGVDLCMVPTEGARQRAIRDGMPDEKLRVVGQPVDLKFLGNSKCKIEHRAELGLKPNVPTLLLVGGGEGMGPLYDIARAIDAARLPAQLAIIAGRNQQLLKKLNAVTWQMSVNVQGFVTNMPDWMRASDVIITKAGPGTIMEAIACDLPILLSGFLPGQEAGNVTFVEQSGVGVLRKTPAEIAQTLGEWLAPGNDTLKQMTIKAHTAARPRAAIDIARTLDGILNAQQIS